MPRAGKDRIRCTNLPSSGDLQQTLCALLNGTAHTVVMTAVEPLIRR